MKYIVKQRVFSFGDKFTIKDEHGEDRFQVNGKVFSFGNKLSLLDMAGNELYFIQQKLMKLLPQYNLLRNDEVVANVKKRMSFFSSKFDIESPTGTYRIEGRPMGFEFKIFRNEEIIANVSKKFFSIGDTYGIDVLNEDDHAFVIALVIIIDQVIHENRN